MNKNCFLYSKSIVVVVVDDDVVVVVVNWFEPKLNLLSIIDIDDIFVCVLDYFYIFLIFGKFVAAAVTR